MEDPTEDRLRVIEKRLDAIERHLIQHIPMSPLPSPVPPVRALTEEEVNQIRGVLARYRLRR